MSKKYLRLIIGRNVWLLRSMTSHLRWLASLLSTICHTLIFHLISSLLRMIPILGGQINLILLQGRLDLFQRLVCETAVLIDERRSIHLTVLVIVTFIHKGRLLLRLCLLLVWILSLRILLTVCDDIGVGIRRNIVSVWWISIATLTLLLFWLHY